MFLLKEARSYFSGVFRGQPLGGTLRIASSAEGSYKTSLFTAAERREYAMYFNVAARRYGWEARLPEEGE